MQVTAHERAVGLMVERDQFDVGSLDYEYRNRAAWKLDQLSRGIPACDWTDTPPKEQRKAS